MSNSGVPQSPEELRQHFNEQIEFLRRSADAFDEGFEAEAKRLSVSLRVLMHDTSVSHSLLAQLGLKDREFLSTTLPQQAENELTHCGLVAQVIDRDGARYIAPLDDCVTHRWLPFETWWDEIVFEDVDGDTLTREQLILNVANKDGGAHVDPKLTEVYAKLSRRNSLAWVSRTKSRERKPIPHPERAAVRQVAHEVLRSLLPEYSKKQPDSSKGAAMFAGAMVTTGAEIPEPPEAETVGRNEPCPCGSGEKFKRCHGRPY